MSSPRESLPLLNGARSTAQAAASRPVDCAEIPLADLSNYRTFVEEAGDRQTARACSYAINPKDWSSDAAGRAASAGAPRTLKQSEELLARVQRMQKFNSHDYDPPDNDLDREIDVEREYADYRTAETWKWLLSVIIGLVMGILAFIVDVGILTASKLKFNTIRALIQSEQSFWAPLLAYLAFTAAFAAAAGSLVSYVEPLAAGSGIPEMKTYLNGLHIKGLMAMRTLVAKLAGIVFSISAGLVAGKEGPFVHGGGIVGGGVAGMGSMTLSNLFGREIRFPRWFGGQFRSDADHRDFVAIGTAAGVATAFNAPIGGLLFTIEEGCSFYSTSIFWRGFLATCTGVMTLHALVETRDDPHGLMHARFGVHRDFGLYSDVIATYGKVYFYRIWELLVFAVMGLAGGFLGVAFIDINVKLTQWRHKHVRVEQRFRRLLEVMLVALVTATTMFTISYLSPCHKTAADVDANALTDLGEVNDEAIYSGGGDKEHFPQLWCKPGEYSIFGQLFFVPLTQALRLMIHLGETMPAGTATDDSQHEYSFYALFAHHLVIFWLMTWTYGVGAASGLFVPCLAMGASMGRMIGQILQAALERAGMDYTLSLPAYTVIGAAATLGGATRMTLSITVLVMETTGSLQLIVPLMLTIFIAKTVGDNFGLGIYDTHIKLRGSPVLDEPNLDFQQKLTADKLTVADMVSRNVLALPPIARATHIVNVLANSSHGAFPVTKEMHSAWHGSELGFKLMGVITRQTLYKILKHRIAFWDATEVPHEAHENIPASQAQRYALQGLLRHRPVKIPERSFGAVVRELTPDELNMMVDLRPFMQRHPCVVPSDAPLSRAYRIFRTLGLRHLFVSAPSPQVIGVLTRKDLTEEVASLRLGEALNQGLVSNIAQNQSSMRMSTQLPFLPYQPYDATVNEAEFPGKAFESLQSLDSIEAGTLPLLNGIDANASDATAAIYAARKAGGFSTGNLQTRAKLSASPAVGHDDHDAIHADVSESSKSEPARLGGDTGASASEPASTPGSMHRGRGAAMGLMATPTSSSHAHGGPSTARASALPGRSAASIVSSSLPPRPGSIAKKPSSTGGNKRS